MNLQILENIGFSKAEIKVYLSLLEIGPSTSGPLIQKAEIQSSVVHRVLKSLIEKGIITYLKIGKNKEYQATDPENILNFIENKKMMFKDILPELKLKQKINKFNYSTEMFMGKKSIFTALLNIIKDGRENEDYFSFSLLEPHDDDEIISFYHTYNSRRRDKKLNVKVMVNKQIKSIYEKNYTCELLKKANVRYTNFHFPQGIVIFRDTIIFINWNYSPSAVKITNKEMALQFKSFFLEFYNKERNAY